MEGKTLGLCITRGLLVLFSVIVLGLAVKLIGDFEPLVEYCKNPTGSVEAAFCSLLNKVNTAQKYNSFAGAFGLIDAAVGLAAVFLAAIPWFVPLAFDALATIFFLAGGINNSVVRGDSGKCGGDGFCTKYDSTTAFLFLGFLGALAAMALVFLQKRSGSRTTSSV